MSFAASQSEKDGDNILVHDILQTMASWNQDLIYGMGDFIAINRETLLPLIIRDDNRTHCFGTPSLSAPAWTEEPFYSQTQPKDMIIDQKGKVLGSVYSSLQQVQQQLFQTQVVQKPSQTPMIQQNTKYYVPQQVKQSLDNTISPPLSQQILSQPEPIVITPTAMVPQLANQTVQPTVLRNSLSAYQTQRVSQQVQSKLVAPKYARECLDRPITLAPEVFSKDIKRYAIISSCVEEQLQHDSQQQRAVLLELPQEMLVEDEPKDENIQRERATIVDHFGRMVAAFNKALDEWEILDADHAAILHNLYSNVHCISQVPINSGFNQRIIAQLPVTNVQLTEPRAMEMLKKNRQQLQNLQKYLHDIIDALAVIYTILQRVSLMLEENSVSNTLLIETYYGLLTHMLDLRTTYRLSKIWSLFIRYINAIGTKTVSNIPDEQGRLLQVLLAAPALPKEIPDPKPSMTLMPSLPPLVQAPALVQNLSLSQHQPQPPVQLFTQTQIGSHTQMTRPPLYAQSSWAMTQPIPPPAPVYLQQQQQSMLPPPQQLPQQMMTQMAYPMMTTQRGVTQTPIQQIRQHLQFSFAKNSERMKLFEPFRPDIVMQRGDSNSIEFIDLLQVVLQDGESFLSVDEITYLCDRFDLKILFEHLAANSLEGSRFTEREEIKLLLHVMHDALCKSHLRVPLGNRILRHCIELAFPNEVSSFIRMLLTLLMQGQYSGTDWPDIILFDQNALSSLRSEQVMEWICIVNSYLHGVERISTVALSSMVTFVSLLLERCPLATPYLQLCDPYSEPVQAVFNFLGDVSILLLRSKKDKEIVLIFNTMMQLLQTLIREAPVLIDRLWTLYMERLFPVVLDNTEMHASLSRVMQQLNWSEATFHENNPIAIEQFYLRITNDPDTICKMFVSLNWDFMQRETDSSLIIPFLKLYIDVTLLQPDIIPSTICRSIEIIRDDDNYDENREALWYRVNPIDFVNAFNGNTISRLLRLGCVRLTRNPSSQLASRCVSLHVLLQLISSKVLVKRSSTKNE